MKWTKFFIPTAKEVPADAHVPSHQLMVRCGMIRQVVAGAYTYLPIGYRTLRKIEAIVREEMNTAGGIELHMPAMHPLEWWEESGRVAAMGDVLLRLGGGGDDWRSRTVLGPTHEEVVTEIARTYITSYKQLPITLYQIQTKFRGEARPKSGVLRTREFLMKDAYSFHVGLGGPGGLDETYRALYKAYCRIFSRCGLPYLSVEADSGPIGGDASHEFMVLTDAGEDYVALSENGDYAANTERATAAPDRQVPACETAETTMLALEELHTPNQRTIDEVCTFLGTTPRQMIKTLIYEVFGSVVASNRMSGEIQRRMRESGVDAMSAQRGFSGEQVTDVIVLVRGDHEVNETKLKSLFPDSRIELAPPEVIQDLTGADVGFAGPHKLAQAGLPYHLVIDPAVVAMRNAVSGANKTGYHVKNVNPGRDFATSGNHVTVTDVRTVLDGDLSPTGSGSPIRLKKAIEVGHVFKLGTKYSDSMQAHYVDADGKIKPFIMGCYGIGLNRIMAAAIEAGHDDKGIIWPVSIAPFQVVICSLDMREDEVVATAERLHDELESAGIDVIFDDRDARPGFKFKDAELIGFPIRVTVGKRGLADGIVEIQTRHDGETRRVAPADAVGTVTTLIEALTPTVREE